jgi:hypothetical protein
MTETKEGNGQLSEQEELEQLAMIIGEVQHSTIQLINRRGLDGKEWHPLNVINMQLFNLVCTARLAAGTYAKQENAE